MKRSVEWKDGVGLFSNKVTVDVTDEGYIEVTVYDKNGHLQEGRFQRQARFTIPLSEARHVFKHLFPESRGAPTADNESPVRDVPAAHSPRTESGQQVEAAGSSTTPGVVFCSMCRARVAWRGDILPGHPIKCDECCAKRARCPTCDSPDPKRHPAMQAEGEVQPCRDAWHAPLPEKISHLCSSVGHGIDNEPYAHETRSIGPLTRKIREQQRDTTPGPVIVMVSGPPTYENCQRCTHSGAEHANEPPYGCCIDRPGRCHCPGFLARPWEDGPEGPRIVPGVPS